MRTIDTMYYNMVPTLYPVRYYNINNTNRSTAYRYPLYRVLYLYIFGNSNRRCFSQKYGLTRRVMIPEYSSGKRTPFFVHKNENTHTMMTAANDFIYTYAMCGGAIKPRVCSLHIRRYRIEI